MLRDKKIAITANGDETVTLTNIYDVKNTKESDLPLEDLAGKGDQLWNTGAAVVAGGPALVEDDGAFKAQHIASVRLYNSNSYVYLHPEDSLKIKVRSANETLYYATMKCDFLKIEISGSSGSSVAESAVTDSDSDGIPDFDDKDV